MSAGEKNQWDEYFNGETKKFKERLLFQEIPQDVERHIHKSQFEYAFRMMQQQAGVQTDPQIGSSFSFPFEWWYHVRGEMFLPVHVEASVDVRGQDFEDHSLETPKYLTFCEEKIYFRMTMRLGEGPIQNMNRLIGMDNPADLSKFDDIKVTFPNHNLPSYCRAPDWTCAVRIGAVDSLIEGILKGFATNVETYIGIFIEDTELNDYVLAFQNSIKHRWGFIK